MLTGNETNATLIGRMHVHYAHTQNSNKNYQKQSFSMYYGNIKNANMP